MTQRFTNFVSRSIRFAMPPSRHGWSPWMGTCAVIGAMMAIYLIVYMSVRSLHRMSDGRLAIYTGSQLANRIFGPAITLETIVRHKPVPDPKTEFKSILAEARSSGKTVLICLGTKTCLPCRQLERLLQSQWAIMSKYVVIMKANVDDEMTPGVLVRDLFRTSPGTEGYIHYYPWIAFLNGNGELLVSSDDGPTGLIGIPHGGSEDRAWFLGMLRVANPTIADDEIARLAAEAKAYHELIWHDRARGNGRKL